MHNNHTKPHLHDNSYKNVHPKNKFKQNFKNLYQKITKMLRFMKNINSIFTIESRNAHKQLYLVV